MSSSSAGSGRRRARVACMQGLYRAELLEEDPGQAEADLAQDEKLPEEVREYARRLLRLVAEHREAIDALLTEALIHWELKRVAVVDRCVLRMGASELLYVPEVPTRVILDEAIEIAKQFGSGDSGRFVNGVLDPIARRHRPDTEAKEETA